MSKPNVIETASALTQALKAMTLRTAELEGALKQHREQIAEQAKALEGAMRLARGTVDVAAPAVAKPAAVHTELSEKVMALITAQPMTLSEIYTTLYANVPNADTKILKQRICNALVKLQRERKGIVNLGTQGRAVWARRV